MTGTRSVGFDLEIFSCRVALTARHDDFTAAHRRARAPSLHQPERHRDERARGVADDREREPLRPKRRRHQQRRDELRGNRGVDSRSTAAHAAFADLD
jgi:hypothetical protein